MKRNWMRKLSDVVDHEKGRSVHQGYESGLFMGNRGEQ